MIKPPFTVIILKNTHHPVTIRVTTGFILLTFGFFSLIGALIGFSLTYFVFPGVDDFSVTLTNNPATVYVPVQPENDVVEVEPDIHSLSIIHKNNDSLELKLSFTSIPGSENVYVWLIMNPDAEIVSEMVIYPRSPIFKGLPVDYRNGITFFPAEENDLTITLSDEMTGIALQQFRIIVYSSDGRIIVDRYFSEPQTPKT